MFTAIDCWLNVLAVRKAVLGLMAVKRMTILATHRPHEAHSLTEHVRKYKEESAQEVLEVHISCPCSLYMSDNLPFHTQDMSIVHHHNFLAEMDIIRQRSQ